MSNGFQYNGKHLSEFGCFISERYMPAPEKKQVLGTVPYMSGSYDFSALYGGPSFEDRTITYKVIAFGDDATSLAAKKQDLVNWLMPCHRGALIDDALPDWYFTAECLYIDEADKSVISEIEIEFIAYPYKRSNTLYTAAYAPSAPADVIVDNTGVFKAVPTLTCEASASVVYGGNTYALGIGAHTDEVFTLAPGSNTFNFTSAKAVTISWRAEVL